MKGKQKGPVQNRALISFRRHASFPASRAGGPSRKALRPREAASRGLIPAVSPGPIAVGVAVITVIGAITVTISVVAVIGARTHIDAQAGAPTAALISATPSGIGGRWRERDPSESHSRG